MEVFAGNFFNIFIAFGLAFLTVVFWLYFWHFFSKKHATPGKFLLKAFILGILGAFFIVFFEKAILAGFLPQNLFSVLRQGRGLGDLQEIIFIFGASLFLTAVPEEAFKFVILKLFLYKSKNFNQIIDGIKFGIVLGLGFALIENSWFFLEQMTIVPFNKESFFLVFLFRFFITTLAHSLYGGVLGYYFGLARFYKIFKSIFLWQGFISAVIFHAFFNFLALTPLNIFTFLILAAALVFLIKWQTDRKNFRTAVSQDLPEKAKAPIFAEQKEMQALIAEGTDSNFRLVKKFGFCPFCFKKLKKEAKICYYCSKELK